MTPSWPTWPPCGGAEGDIALSQSVEVVFHGNIEPSMGTNEPDTPSIGPRYAGFGSKVVPERRRSAPWCRVRGRDRVIRAHLPRRGRRIGRQRALLLVASAVRSTRSGAKQRCAVGALLTVLCRGGRGRCHAG